jgi:hypothetical protein
MMAPTVPTRRQRQGQPVRGQPPTTVRAQATTPQSHHSDLRRAFLDLLVGIPICVGVVWVFLDYPVLA